MPVFTVSLLLALATVPQSQRPAVPKTSSAVGRVVDASNGRPIAGAIVTLFGSAAVPVPRAGQPRGAPAPRLMTNAAGQFVARGLGKGSLFLVVTKGGYVDASNAQRRPGGSAQPIDVTEGQRITDIEVRMWRHAVIAGTVINEAGEPVVGARVQSYRRGFAAGRVVFTASASATTDDRGMYRLANLVPNDYQIAVVSTQVAVPTAAINTLRQGTAGAAQRAELSRDVGAIGSPGAPSGTPFAMMAGGQTLTLTPGTATTMERTWNDRSRDRDNDQRSGRSVHIPRRPAGSVPAVSASGALPVAPSIPPPIPADATLVAEAAIAVGDADVTGVTLALRVGPRVSGDASNSTAQENARTPQRSRTCASHWIPPMARSCRSDWDS